MLLASLVSAETTNAPGAHAPADTTGGTRTPSEPSLGTISQSPPQCSTTGNADVVSDIAATGCLARLLVCLKSMTTVTTILDTLYAMFSNTKLVKEAHDKGAVIYLLDVFCNSDLPANREKAAEVRHTHLLPGPNQATDIVLGAE